MIVREKMARKEEQTKARQNIKEREAAASKRVTKKVEDGAPVDSNWIQQETLKTRALDRSYKSVMSISPLKYRVEYDVEGSPSRRLETLKSPNRSLSRGRNQQSTVQKQEIDYYQQKTSPNR